MRGLAILLSLLFLPHAFADSTGREWQFRVMLGEKELGTHLFSLQDNGDTQRIESQANFEYRFLFFKLYEYQHENTETWQDNCLTDINALTDDNGEIYQVRGERNGERFVVRHGDDVADLPPCIMSFAYWNPAFLDEKYLLNSQTGEFLQVEVHGPEPAEVEVQGSLRTANRYLLEAGEMDIRLWYSEQHEWLALETEVDGGKTLRYELL